MPVTLDQDTTESGRVNIIFPCIKDSGCLETFSHAWSPQDVGKQQRPEELGMRVWSTHYQFCTLSKLITPHCRGWGHTQEVFSIKGQTECFGAIIISPWSCGRKVATENVDITDYDSMSIKLYWFIKMLSGKDYNSIWGNTQERQVHRDRWAASCLEQGFFWVMTIFYKKTMSW